MLYDILDCKNLLIIKINFYQLIFIYYNFKVLFILFCFIKLNFNTIK
jgi:hypothetical protein